MNMQDLKKAARKAGATVRDMHHPYPHVSYEVILPAGKRWDEDLHALVVDYNAELECDSDEAIEDAIERIETYVSIGHPEPCDCEECQEELAEGAQQ
jgi:hypothetical protein